MEIEAVVDKVKPVENKYSSALVLMANNLAKIKLGLTLRETKFVLLVFSQISKRDLFGWITLNRREIVNIFGMNANDIDKIEDIFLDIAGKLKLKIVNEDGSRTSGLFLHTAHIDPRNKSNIKVQINQNFTPYLENLERNFTYFYLNNIAKFKSKYSVLLFQFLRFSHNKNVLYTDLKVGLKELKSVFELSPTDYTVKRKNKKTGEEKMVFDIYNFEKKVLSKAINEINKDISQSRMNLVDIKGDKKYFEKIKVKNEEGIFVTAYRFYYCLVDENNNPTIKENIKKPVQTLFPINEE